MPVRVTAHSMLTLTGYAQYRAKQNKRRLTQAHADLGVCQRAHKGGQALREVVDEEGQGGEQACRARGGGGCGRHVGEQEAAGSRAPLAAQSTDIIKQRAARPAGHSEAAESQLNRTHLLEHEGVVVCLHQLHNRRWGAAGGAAARCRLTLQTAQMGQRGIRAEKGSSGDGRGAAAVAWTHNWGRFLATIPLSRTPFPEPIRPKPLPLPRRRPACPPHRRPPPCRGSWPPPRRWSWRRRARSAAWQEPTARSSGCSRCCARWARRRRPRSHRLQMATAHRRRLLPGACWLPSRCSPHPCLPPPAGPLPLLQAQPRWPAAAWECWARPARWWVLPPRRHPRAEHSAGPHGSANWRLRCWQGCGRGLPPCAGSAWRPGAPACGRSAPNEHETAGSFMPDRRQQAAV